MNDQRSMIRGEYVYVIQAGEGGPVKIGIAADPPRRLKELQTGNPVQLRLLTSLPGGQSLERDLHSRLAAHRMTGEWFHPHPEVMAAVREEQYCGGRTDTRYSTRYAQCENCKVLMGGDPAWAFGDPPPPSLCEACQEFAELRASGIDPFAEP